MKKLSLPLLLLALPCAAQITYPPVVVPGNPASSVTAVGPAFGYFNDFLNTVGATCGGIGSPTGNSASVGDNAQTFNVPGYYTMASGTVSGSGEFCTWGSGRPLIAMNAGQWTMEFRAEVPVLPGTTAATYELGLSNSASALPWTGTAVAAAFCLSTANTCGTGVAANHWACVGGTTTADSGVTATTGWVRLTVTADGTNMNYAINGTQVCTIAQSNATANNVYLGLPSVQAGSTTSVNLLLDYFSMYAAVSR